MHNSYNVFLFFYFAALKIHALLANFEANHMHKQVIKKKNSENVEASSQGYT